MYLLILMLLTSAVFALPIFFAPLRWARVLQWRIPEDVGLVIYFGRCTGALVLIFEALMFRAWLTGSGLTFTFEVLVALATMMVIVHTWGAIRRIQPWTETAEIALYAGLGVLTLLFYPN
ncbi:hypothetical protein [Streptomyces sp. SID13031]|uniref:hypothetical protein n=1 Tax=Streptomyces sp. SID13031 TaxID=2706046 RepID=UPI001943B154|nr:hypothetical protein [Streptomyces sp. SID13031]